MPVVIEPTAEPVETEELSLNGLALNDVVTFGIQEIVFKPAEARPQWAENPNADGSVPVQEPHYTNAIFELTIRVRQSGSTDVGLERMGELIDAVQSCARLEGGAPIEWAPKGSTTTWTAYALLGELVEVPTESSGDLAGWLLTSPVVKLRLTCRPFLVKEGVVALEATESGAEPQQVLYVECGGDVPAEAELILTDKSSQDRRFLRVGLDVVEATTGNPPTLITAASLVTTEFSGEAKTRSGAYSEEKVKRATAIGQATTLCGTGGIAHVGSFRAIAHVYAASEQARYRISYRNGDGPLTTLNWQAPPVAAGFCDLDMGEVFFEEAGQGEQRGEIRVEVKSADGSVAAETDLNYLELYPTVGLTKSRGIASTAATKLLAYDTFVQSAGALSGKVLPLGGTWSGAGDETDFAVVSSGETHVLQRTATGDVDLNTGRYAIAGSEKPTTAKVSVRFSTPSVLVGLAEKFRHGVFLRYQNPENWIAAYVRDRNVVAGYYLTVAKRVGGGEITPLGVIKVQGGGAFDSTIGLQAGADGAWQAWCFPGTEAGPLLTGHDADLVTGGSLAEGKTGILDAYTPSGLFSAKTRTYDNFSILAGEAPNRVCYSGRSARLTSDGFTREDSSGKYGGSASQTRGANLYMRPGVNRLVVSMRRNDADVETVPNVTDRHTAEALVTERFLAPR